MSTVLHKELELKEIAQTADEAMYLTIATPVNLEGENPDANRIRLKNLISETESKLVERKIAPDIQKQLMKGLLSLDLDNLIVPGLQGLALIAKMDEPSEIHIYPLWSAPETRVSLKDNPVTAPILRGNLHHSVLVACLADNGVRLFRADRGCLKEIMDVKEMPESLAEVIRFEESAGLDGNEHYRNTAGATTMTSHTGRNMNSLDDEFQSRYFRLVGAALKEQVKFDEKIVIAAVKEKAEKFRRLNPELPILSVGLDGNWNSETEPKLREAVVDLLRQKRSELIEHRLETIRSMRPERKLTDLTSCLTAAKQGRLEYLLINEETLNDETDELIFQTARTQGQIYLVPEDELDTPVLAQTRW